MARTKTFAEKVIKRGQKFGKICPKCEEEIAFVKRVEPVKKDNGGMGFVERMQPYCKCNTKEAFEQ